MSRRYCVGVNIDYLLRLDDKELGRWITEPDGKPLDPAVARQRLEKLKSQGFELVPPCNVVDERGYCQGHEIEA